MQKTKTQITINESLALIVSSVQEKYPIYDTNAAIEYLLARGSGSFLEDLGLSAQDLKDIALSKHEIKSGLGTKTQGGTDLIKKLNS
jgi:hypothetical protein